MLVSSKPVRQIPDKKINSINRGKVGAKPHRIVHMPPEKREKSKIGFLPKYSVSTGNVRPEKMAPRINGLPMKNED